MQIIQVDDCLGRRWAVSPARRTIYYAASLSPVEVAQAIMDAVAALSAHDQRRPRLRLVHSADRVKRPAS